MNNKQLIDKYCLYCNKQLSYKQRKQKFCSKHCANTYNNLHRSKKIYIQQSKSLKETLSKKKKHRLCKFCGQEKGYCLNNLFEICKHYQILRTLIKYFQFNQLTLGSKNIFKEFTKIRNLIEKEYKENRITDQELKEKYNYKSGIANFHKILKTLNIKRFSRKEAVNKAIELKRLGFEHQKTKYFSSWHITWDNKKVYLRSSYELDYAKELDNLKINYSVEDLRIKYYDTQHQKYRIAIPDFYLIEYNKIVEIKSNYTLNIQEMKDKAKAYIKQGYAFQLIVDHKEIDINKI